MLAAQGEAHGIVGIGEDFFHFLQARGGNHEAQVPSGGLLGVVGSPCQPEAVHGHGGDGIVGNLKLDAVVDGPGLVIRHGEDGAGDQLLQLILGDADGVAGADVGKVGVFVGRFCADGEGSVAGADGDLEVVVHHHGDGAFGQAADDVAEELGQDALTAVADIGIDVIGDGGFHIVAGEGQTGTGPAEDTLDGAEGALLGHRPGGNVQSLKEGIFFTGKTHGGSPSFVRIKIYIYISEV